MLTRTIVRSRIKSERRDIMKEYLGYLIIIIVGVLGFVLLSERVEDIDNNISINESAEIYG